MDWDDFRYVLAIARDRTLMSAAAGLGVAHTTVSRRVKTLEERLGVRLFHRTTEGLIPTAAGEDLAAMAQRLEDEVLAAEGRLLGRDARLVGALRVSIADILFHGFDEAFASFVERYPSIDLTICASPELASLARREADAVLRLSNAPPDHYVGRKLGHVQFAVYASRKLVEHVGKDAPLEAFPWIGWDERQDFRWFDTWLAENAPGARIVFRLENNILLRARAIRAGMGAQILPCFLADPDEGLQRIAPLEESFKLDLWVLTLAELRTNSRVRAFMSHMAEALRPYRDALAGRLSGTGSGGADR